MIVMTFTCNNYYNKFDDDKIIRKKYHRREHVTLYNIIYYNN